MVQTFTFTLVLDGFAAEDDQVEDALFEAGCDDGLLAYRGGTPTLEFDRESETLEDAVLSAIQNVEAAGVGATVLRVEPDDLVNASEVARRTGTSRESVRLWREGERGPGDFPPPVASVGTNTTLWSWAEVASWLHATGKLDDLEAIDHARFLATLNALLNEQRYASLVDRGGALRKALSKSGALKRVRAVAATQERADTKVG